MNCIPVKPVDAGIWKEGRKGIVPEAFRMAPAVTTPRFISRRGGNTGGRFLSEGRFAVAGCCKSDSPIVRGSSNGIRCL